LGYLQNIDDFFLELEEVPELELEKEKQKNKQNERTRKNGREKVKEVTEKCLLFQLQQQSLLKLMIQVFFNLPSSLFSSLSFFSFSLILTICEKLKKSWRHRKACWKIRPKRYQ